MYIYGFRSLIHSAKSFSKSFYFMLGQTGNLESPRSWRESSRKAEKPGRSKYFHIFLISPNFHTNIFPLTRSIRTFADVPCSSWAALPISIITNKLHSPRWLKLSLLLKMLHLIISSFHFVLIMPFISV